MSENLSGSNCINEDLCELFGENRSKSGNYNKTIPMIKRKRNSLNEESRNNRDSANQNEKSKKRLNRSKSESDIVRNNTSKEDRGGNLGKSASQDVDECGDRLENSSKTMEKLNYKCSFDQCNQYFRREKDLDKHEFQHNGVKKYSCEFVGCSKKYRLRAHLKRHIQTFHEKKKDGTEKTIKCEIESCSKQFASRYSARRHLKEFHGKTRKFPCPECGRVYERKNHLKVHRIIHTKEYPYKCYRCTEGFVTEVAFKRHNCAKHECDICNENFSKWSELVQHRHEKHPPSYICDKCEKKCVSKQEYKSHKKIHRERHSCPWEGCSNSYLDRRNLKNHIKIKHLHEKYKCTFEGCDEELSSKSKLYYHLRTHEKPKSQIESKKHTTNNRKKRKDAGISKKSMVGILANFVVHPKVDQILKNNICDVDIQNLSEHDTSETDGEERPNMVQVELKLQNT